ncbi:MAG: M1 family metallopeptidase, partial [Gemmatirosa sp.]|nr:M1 family metallopeptidase [Gemmatirosa sp.]
MPYRRIVVLALCVPGLLAAQTRPAPSVGSVGIAESRRPLPGDVYEQPGFTRAVERGTRTRTGRPGARHWVQHARYAIDATLDVATHTLRGSERVTYVNASPDTLRQLAIHLRQNAFRPESQRRDDTPLTGGLTLGRVAVGGVATPRYTVGGTVMRLALPAPLAPHDSVSLAIDWSFVPPLTPSDGRQGRDEQLYFMGYWYPQVAVYDDVNGWVADQYLLEAEFYMDPADYDVRVTVPRGWPVGATGTLQNADSVLTAAARARLAEAHRTRGTVTISRPDDGGAAFAGTGATATWHFTAPDVRDFAWGTSDRYVWDATSAVLAGAGGRPDTVDIHSLYRLHAPAAAWPSGGARYTRDAIEQLSAYLWPYPWPTMTSMEGVLTGGGMEYPRLTIMQPWADTLSLAGDLMHETGHMWFPMQVGSNETRYPWMDEGFTQFDAAQGMRALYGEPRTGGRPNDQEPGQRRSYLQRAAAGQDQ